MFTRQLFDYIIKIKNSNCIIAFSDYFADKVIIHTSTTNSTRKIAL